MAARFSKEIRQEIVREFATRHNGQYDAALFLREVSEQGAGHPAYDWFEWDAEAAAESFRLSQARDFARDLRIVFKVEEITAPNQVRVVERAMPLVISPMGGRKKGGGYVLVDPDDPSHMDEHCRQAAAALSQWVERYGAALSYVGVKRVDLDRVVHKLENGRAKKIA